MTSAMSGILCGQDLYKEMKSTFDYSQITWTINRYNKSISDEQAEELLSAFLQWISVVPAIEIGESNTFVMLETPIEEAFHSFVLNTKLYQKFCDQFLGFFFHHNPLKEETGAEIDAGVKYTVELLELQYGENLHPLLKEWRIMLNNGTYKVACVKCKAPF
jgi:hypothetical protein